MSSQKPLYTVNHYQDIAEILGALNARGLHGGAIALTKLNEIFIEHFAEDNPRFDRAKFNEWVLRARADESLEMWGKHE